jgi:hypothetical protein
MRASLVGQPLSVEVYRKKLRLITDSRSKKSWEASASRCMYVLYDRETFYAHREE